MKVYVVTEENIWDFEHNPIAVEVFADKAEVKEEFERRKQNVDEEYQDAFGEEVEVYEGESCYEVGESGRFAENSTRINVQEFDVPMTREMHLLGEDIQEITLQAFPIIYGKNNPYDLDSRIVLNTFREWAEEFDLWWSNHDDKWHSNHDYLQEIANFTDKKVGAYLRELNYKN